MISDWKLGIIEKSRWVIISCTDNKVVCWFDDPDEMSKYLGKLKKRHPHNTYKVATLC